MIGRDELELALVRVERYIPYLRRHVAEFEQSPTTEHRKQAYATLRHFRESCQTIDRFLSQQRR